MAHTPHKLIAVKGDFYGKKSEAGGDQTQNSQLFRDTRPISITGAFGGELGQLIGLLGHKTS